MKWYSYSIPQRSSTSTAYAEYEYENPWSDTETSGHGVSGDTHGSRSCVLRDSKDDFARLERLVGVLCVVIDFKAHAA